MSDAALTIRGLRKQYGRLTALDGLDFSVPRGVICGLIGPNGAGKTTTFGIVGGYVKSDGGEVDILGTGPFDPARHVGRITLLPQDCELNPYTTVRELLAYYGQLQGLDSRTARDEADRVLDLVALTERAGSRIRQLSHGMRRRVAVAQALVGDPELVLLDEPVSGLDPELVVRMREIFATQRGERTLVISSHNLAELEAVCDYVVFMHEGQCVREGTLADVTERGPMMRYELAEPVATDGLAVDGVDLSAEGTLVIARGTREMSAPDINAIVLPALLEAGARIIEIRQGRSLEAAYLEGKS